MIPVINNEYDEMNEMILKTYQKEKIRYLLREKYINEMEIEELRKRKEMYIHMGSNIKNHEVVFVDDDNIKTDYIQ